MKRIINVDSSLDAKIEDLVKEKNYRDYQHFAVVALQNQIAWETSDSQSSTAVSDFHPEATDRPSLISLGYKLLTAPSEPGETLSVNEGGGGVLGWQYYRFLPAKFGVRILANMSLNELPHLRDFTATAADIAVLFRSQLVKLDKADRREFGELLSASFPTKQDKSKYRFASQFMIYLRRSNMTLLGMLPELKLVNIKVNEDGTVRVGLTRHGWRFAELTNPAIDSNRPQSLSKEEIEFLQDHIADNLPEELEHMTVALKALNDGKRTREEMNGVLRTYYGRHQTSKDWSEAVVNTMRSGLFSRLNDLGLITRRKEGKNVSYSVTDAGRQYIEGVRYA